MKATKAQIQLRVNDLVQFRLEGARFWDVRQYVTEKENEPGSIWHRGENAKPHSEATLWRYIRWADALIAEDTRSSRKKRLRLHVAKRQNLYAKAISQGDVRTALAAADSEAKLLGLFAATGVEVTGKGGTPLYPSLEAMVAALMKMEQNGGHDDAAKEESGGDEGDGAPPAGGDAMPG
jgi:hypothetical protein